MSEEEIFEGLSFATTLVEQGLLSKNRRAIMKELILRWDTNMLRALRARAVNADVLGQEFGMIAVDEIQRMVKRALNKREIHWPALPSLALALQHLSILPGSNCVCIEEGDGELSMATSLLEDFQGVQGILVRAAAVDVAGRSSQFDVVLRPMLDSSLSGNFSFSMSQCSSPCDTEAVWMNANIFVISLSKAGIVAVKSTGTLNSMKPGSYVIILGDMEEDFLGDQFQLLYTLSLTTGSPPALVFFRTEVDTNSNNGPPSTPPLRAQPAELTDYTSSPMGSKLMQRKRAHSPKSVFPGDEDSDAGIPLVESSPNDSRLMVRKNICRAEEADPITTEKLAATRGEAAFMESASSPQGARLLDRKIQFSQGNKDFHTSNLAREIKSAPKNSLSPLQRRLFSHGHYSKMNPSTTNATNGAPLPSSPFGDALLTRRQFPNSIKLDDVGCDIPAAASSPLSGSLLAQKHRIAREGVLPASSVNSGADLPAVSSPMSAGLLARKHMKKVENGIDQSGEGDINVFGTSSPMSTSVLARKHASRVASLSEDEGNGGFEGFDDLPAASSPMSAGLLARKHNVRRKDFPEDREGGVGHLYGSNEARRGNGTSAVENGNISSPLSGRLLARKHSTFSGGSSEQWK